MAAAGAALVNAHTLASLSSNQRIRAERGSQMRALTGRHVTVPLGTQRLQRKSCVRQVQIRAGPVGTKEEQGEASRQQKKSEAEALHKKKIDHLQRIIVRVHDEHFKFTPDGPAHAIGAALECLAGKPGVLVRAGDNYTPLADEEVPAGEYTFKTRSSFDGSKEEHAKIMEHIRAINEMITKLQKLERRRNFFRF